MQYTTLCGGKSLVFSNFSTRSNLCFLSQITQLQFKNLRELSYSKSVTLDSNKVVLPQMSRVSNLALTPPECTARDTRRFTHSVKKRLRALQGY